MSKIAILWVLLPWMALSSPAPTTDPLSSPSLASPTLKPSHHPHTRLPTPKPTHHPHSQHPSPEPTKLPIHHPSAMPHHPSAMPHHPSAHPHQPSAKPNLVAPHISVTPAPTPTRTDEENDINTIDDLNDAKAKVSIVAPPTSEKSVETKESLSQGGKVGISFLVIFAIGLGVYAVIVMRKSGATPRTADSAGVIDPDGSSLAMEEVPISEPDEAIKETGGEEGKSSRIIL
jgi:hypothetical protein